MSRSYLYPCPCGAQIPLAETQAGRELACPQCQATFVLATLKDIRRLPPAPQQESAKTTGGGQWSGTRGMIFAAGIVFVLSGVLAAGFLGYYRAKLNASYTIEQDIEYGDQAIDNATPFDAFNAYVEFRRHGLGEQIGLEYLVESETARQLEWGMIFAGGWGLVGLLMCVGSLVFSRAARR